MKKSDIKWEATAVYTHADYIEATFNDRSRLRSGLRPMPLVDIAKTAILESQTRQAQHKNELGSLNYEKDSDYLCLDEYGRRLKSNRIIICHKRLLEKHDFRHICYHRLRFSCITMLLSKGIPIEKIQKWLGHDYFQRIMQHTNLPIDRRNE
jgi:integrase